MNKIIEAIIDLEQNQLPKTISKAPQLLIPSLKKEIDDDFSNIFAFDKDKFTLVRQEAIRKFPSTDLGEDLENILFFYKSNKYIKNRIETIENNIDTKAAMELFTRLVYDLRKAYIIKRYFFLMDKGRERRIQKIYKKMQFLARFHQKLKGLNDLLGNFWSLSYKSLYHMEPSFINKMNKLMDKKSFIKEIAQLLGKAAHAFKQYEEKLIKAMKLIPAQKKTFYSPENLIGVTQGRHIPDLLPYSLLLLKNKATNKIFKLHYMEGKLQQFDKKTKMFDQIYTLRKKRVLKKNNKGPFILVIDTSGSMIGEPEAIAKAMALAFVKIANQEERKCFIINFSTNVIEFDASNLGKSWHEFYNFLSTSFYGGTDINIAIERAVFRVKQEEWENSDVIFISDMIVDGLNSDLKKAIIELKEKRVRFHALTIGHSFIKKNIKFLDNNWIYDGSKASIRKMIEDLNNFNSSLKIATKAAV